VTGIFCFIEYNLSVAKSNASSDEVHSPKDEYTFLRMSNGIKATHDSHLDPVAAKFQILK